MIKIRANSSGPWHTGNLLRLCIVISLLLHLCLVLGLHKIPLWPGFGEEIRVYEVELLRPPVEDIGDEEITPSDLARINKEQQEETKQAEQETISLDTRDKRYVSYAKVIQERIQRHWRYPPQAKENLIEGKLVVMFSLNPGGAVIDVRIMKTSGFEILDEGAVQGITLAAPFPPIPPHIKVKRLNVVANFDYRLTSRK
jgi:TonB family protein